MIKLAMTQGRRPLTFLSSSVRLLLLLFFLVSTGGPKPAQGYPHYIGYSYNSCTVCHFNPLGNGPLTDYGRALSATAISARPPFFGGTDEELGEQSGIFGTKTSSWLGEWVRAQVNYRSLWYQTQLGTNSQLRQIPMVADASLILKTPSNQIYGVLNFGYFPKPAGLSPKQSAQISSQISREHYIGYRHGKKLGFYLGFMDIAFGLRIPDHYLSSRRKTLLAQNDQTHGLLIHGAFGKTEGAFHLFLGNLLQSPDLRNKGLSLFLERDIAEKMRLGFSSMHTANDYRKRTTLATHFRLGAGEGTALLSETGFIFEKIASNTRNQPTSQYWTTQTMTRLARGIALIGTFDYFALKSFGPGTRSITMGPGIQYFPLSRLELRSDLSVTRAVGATSVGPDQFSLLTQVHVWL